MKSNITLIDAMKRTKEGKGILIIRKSITKGQKIIGYSESKL
jgi:hypothetical protein